MDGDCEELLFGSNQLTEILLSSIMLATLVAVIGTVIAMMTARATEIYRIRGRQAVGIAALLPLLVPGTVFAMGIQVSLIRMHLNDTIAGVVLVHLVAALPYCVTIMMDVTAAVGDSLEEQAAVLGAGPFRSFIDASLPGIMPGVLSSASMAERRQSSCVYIFDSICRVGADSVLPAGSGDTQDHEKGQMIIKKRWGSG